MSEHRFCQQPDRHEPKLKCGYLLPCPHHTVVMDLRKRRGKKKHRGGGK